MFMTSIVLMYSLSRVNDVDSVDTICMKMVFFVNSALKVKSSPLHYIRKYIIGCVLRVRVYRYSSLGNVYLANRHKRYVFGGKPIPSELSATLYTYSDTFKPLYKLHTLTLIALAMCNFLSFSISLKTVGFRASTAYI